jgi:hypothetical protein
MKITKVLIAVLSLYVLQSCTSDFDEFTEEEVFSEELLINDQNLYPTKFDFDFSRDQFIVASGARSSVGHIDPKTGVYTPFITDINLATIPEVYTDEENNRLIVTCGDLGVSANMYSYLSYAYMGVYNLETGEKIAGVNFEGLHEVGAYQMANAISVDDLGNIYVADTFAPVIYKVDGQTYEPSILVKDAKFESDQVGSPGLLGMIYVDGNLIVSKENEGKLFKVSLSNPSEVIDIKAPTYIGAKGMELLSDHKIALTIGGPTAPFSGVITLAFNDDWTDADGVSYFESLPAEKFPLATTIASDGELYMINSHFQPIFRGETTEQFSIVRVE